MKVKEGAELPIQKTPASNIPAKCIKFVPTVNADGHVSYKTLMCTKSKRGERWYQVEEYDEIRFNYFGDFVYGCKINKDGEITITAMKI